MTTVRMDHPMCLVGNEDGELVFNQEAVNILSTITQPVVPVAIVGKYRTGKSYLMNKLAGCTNGFSLGSTIQSMTKGIWMWCIPHPIKTGQTLVLLDTEGLGDVEKGDSKNDAWIFSLAVLLSSTLVFNSMGTIDQQAMDQLHYVTELTERIKMTSREGTENDEDEEENDESGQFKRFFPSFIWCVRDFTLSLEIGEKKITEDEYLQNSLTLKKGTGKKVTEYNLPRECIIHYFQSRKCFVFDRPADKNGLQNLDKMPESKLEPEFVKQTARFLSHVYQGSNTKTLPGGLVVTGRMLGNLTITYVDAIRSGSVPCMENAVQALAKIENTAAVNEALSKYEAEMNLRIGDFPTETQEQFLKLHQDAEKEALKVFMDRSFKDENQEYQTKLIDGLQIKMSEYSQLNEQTSDQKCKALIQQLGTFLDRGISEGQYSKPGGHKLFVEEKQKLIDAYNKHSGKGIKALEVLKTFLAEKEKVEAAVLQADQSLTEKDKKIAEQRAQSEAAERDKMILEQSNRNLEHIIDNQKESFKNHEEMLKAKMEKERDDLKRENERLIKQKLKEQQDMAKRGHKRQYDMLQEQITDLKKENEGSVLGNIVAAILPGVFGKLARKCL
ncbi:guanylate-binding protein 1-like [Discoglossus pictus]